MCATENSIIVHPCLHMLAREIRVGHGHAGGQLFALAMYYHVLPSIECSDDRSWLGNKFLSFLLIIY